MKNQILDSPLHHSFSDFLKKGETIIWEGQPSLKSDSSFNSDPDDYNNYDRHTTVTLFIIGMILLLAIEDTHYFAWFFFIALTFLAVVLPAWMRKIKKDYKYAMTQNQILFHFRKNWFGKKVFYSISFSEIKDIIVVMTYDIEKIKAGYQEAAQAIPEVYNRPGLEKIGTIFLASHHPQLINIETVDVTNNNKRHQPTLEHLEDVNMVAKIIREGIKANRLS